LTGAQPPSRQPSRDNIVLLLGVGHQPITEDVVLPILVVDDDSSIADLLKIILEDEGYRVLTASNGLDALHLMAQEKPSLVITDVVMPVMGGVDLISRIHADPDLQGVPVVLMSAMKEPTTDGLTYRFVEKPFDLGAMVDLVAELTSDNVYQPRGGLWLGSW
jgi:CheY-like chemotaxis protein